MLHRRSIRTKLVYALAVLTMIFCFLAFSAVMGAHRYRRLADSVRQQATEIPHANELCRCAQAIRQSHDRLIKIRHTSLLSGSEKEIENYSITQNLIELELTLTEYKAELESSSDNARILVDRHRQQQSLADIQTVMESIDQLMVEPAMMTRQGELQFAALATQLVQKTQSHLDLIHSEMVHFSEDVRGQYKGWIVVNLVCMAIAVFLVSVLWFSFQSLVAKPFHTLLAGSRLVASGQYGHRIDLGTNDELNELAEAMNGMSTKFRDVYDRQRMTNDELDRQVKERTREVIQNEQLASVGFLAAGVAHEINNPLASIAWSAESLQAELDDLLMANPNAIDVDISKSLQVNLPRIQQEAYRGKGITERLLDFSRLGDISRTSVDLVALVKDVVEIVSTLGKYKCKQLRVECAPSVTAHCNSHEIRQVVLNLVTNALESVEEDGRVVVHVRNRDGQAYVGVYDNGCGMNSEVLNHLFEPFFTRRRDGTGTGLGLSITYRIVSQHHGSLVASSGGEGKGSRMEMTLPITCLLYTSPSPRDATLSRMPSSA